jgi:hypothetical protein
MGGCSVRLVQQRCEIHVQSFAYQQDSGFTERRPPSGFQILDRPHVDAGPVAKVQLRQMLFYPRMFQSFPYSLCGNYFHDITENG